MHAAGFHKYFCNDVTFKAISIFFIIYLLTVFDVMCNVVLVIDLRHFATKRKHYAICCASSDIECFQSVGICELDSKMTSFSKTAGGRRD